ncbi:hypothetical protein HEP87_03525 [Streptomyces sp. S1D4-11]
MTASDALPGYQALAAGGDHVPQRGAGPGVPTIAAYRPGRAAGASSLSGYKR